MRLYTFNDKDYNIGLIEFAEPIEIQNPDNKSYQEDYMKKAESLLKDMGMDKFNYDTIVFSANNPYPLTEQDRYNAWIERNRKYVEERLGPYPNKLYDTFYDIHFTTGSTIRVSEEDWIAFKNTIE